MTASRLGIASAVAGAIWLGGLALNDSGVRSPWVMAGGALLLSGCSTLINGVIGREMVRRKELQRDLQAAVRVQRSLFPSALPRKRMDGLRSAGSPARCSSFAMETW